MGVGQITHLSSGGNPETHATQTDAHRYAAHTYTHTQTNTHPPSNQVICVGMILMPCICEALV